MAAGTSEELQMLSAFSIQDISVANFGQPYKSFRLFRRGSGSSRENCLSILILTNVSEFWDKWLTTKSTILWNESHRSHDCFAKGCPKAASKRAPATKTEKN